LSFDDGMLFAPGRARTSRERDQAIACQLPRTVTRRRCLDSRTAAAREQQLSGYMNGGDWRADYVSSPSRDKAALRPNAAPAIIDTATWWAMHGTNNSGVSTPTPNLKLMAAM